MVKPLWWDDAQNSLCQTQPKLTELVNSSSGHFLLNRGQYFETLLRAIVGQQISIKAANSIWLRLHALIVDVLPERILAQTNEALKIVGLSTKKVDYVKDLAAHFADGRLDAEKLALASDDEVILALTDVHGIGVWSAQMFLIFALGRQDIWPIADVGLQKALQGYYELPERPTPSICTKLGEDFKPYRTFACFFLWQSLNSDETQY